ncbi:MAG: hypothetical protein IJA84_05425, partial [Clostridia bacterium]|nr:hypothetical protein [Clostridia bacterium]
MKKPNRLLAMALALVLVLSLTACGGVEEFVVDQVKDYLNSEGDGSSSSETPQTAGSKPGESEQP